MVTTIEFKNFINLKNDFYNDKINLIIDGVNKFVQSYCKNQLVYGDVTEYFNGDDIIANGDQIFLNNRINIADVLVYYNAGTEASPSWTVEDRDNYSILADEGIIKLNFTRGNLGVQSGYNNYKITYNAGYAENAVPDDLKLACLKLATAFYNKSESEGEASQSLEGASVNFQNSITTEIKILLAPYKRH